MAVSSFSSAAGAASGGAQTYVINGVGEVTATIPAGAYSAISDRGFTIGGVNYSGGKEHIIYLSTTATSAVLGPKDLTAVFESGSVTASMTSYGMRTMQKSSYNGQRLLGSNSSSVQLFVSTTGLKWSQFNATNTTSYRVFAMGKRSSGRYGLLTSSGSNYGSWYSSNGGLTWATTGSNLVNSYYEFYSVGKNAVTDGDYGWMAGYYNYNSSRYVLSYTTALNPVDNYWTSASTILNTNFSTTRPVYGINYGNNTYVAVGDSGTTAYSVGGPNNWTSSNNIGGSPTMFDVVYSTTNSMWVAVGDNSIAYSTTGATWSTGVTGVQSGTLNFVNEYDGEFVATGNNGALYTSTNGINWTKQTITVSSELSKPQYLVDKWVVHTEYGTSNSRVPELYISTNLSSWNSPIVISSAKTSVTNDNNSVVMLAGAKQVAITTNGTTWIKKEIGTTYDIYSSAYGNGRWILGTGQFPSSQVAVSTNNGGSWSLYNMTPSSSNTLRDIEYGNGVFVAVGSSFISYSSTGTSWTQTGYTSHDFQRVVFVNGTFIALGTNSNAIYYGISEDGANWAIHYLKGGFIGDMKYINNDLVYSYGQTLYNGSSTFQEYSTVVGKGGTLFGERSDSVDTDYLGNYVNGIYISPVRNTLAYGNSAADLDGSILVSGADTVEAIEALPNNSGIVAASNNGSVSVLQGENNSTLSLTLLSENVIL